MKRKVVQRAAARRDLTRIFVYISEQNIDAGHRFVIAVEADVQRLAEFPGLGALRAFKFKSPRLREVRSLPVTGFRNYLIFYQSTRTTVEILRVIHGARNLGPLLGEE